MPTQPKHTLLAFTMHSLGGYLAKLQLLTTSQLSISFAIYMAKLMTYISGEKETS